MGRLARKTKRKAALNVPGNIIDSSKQLADSGTEIVLENPVAQHFESFIAGNATKCDRVVDIGEAKGQHIVICGAGPSLRDHTDLLDDADQVWGCNSALIWLLDNGHRVTHGFTVDQTPMQVEEWASAPDVKYLLASSVHPHMVELLEVKNRHVTFFHNYVGLKKPPVAMEDPQGGPDIPVPYEDWMYMALYPETVRAGSGLNAVTRAWDVAYVMGASKITILGADCALRASRPPDGMVQGSEEHMTWLRDECEMHADGGHALASGATPVTVEGMIDGRFWVTKPDMMITAVFMVQMKRHFGDRVEIIGDTLPNALMDKDDEFLDRLPCLATADGRAIRYSPGVLDAELTGGV